MIRRLVLVVTLLMWAPAHAALDVDFGRYHALVVGINAYKNLPALETAVNDASAVADVLRQKYGFEVTLLLNPGRSEVIRALDKLRGELTERDNLLIYYAGHGVLDVEADAGFWLSVDAEEGTRADWISIGAVTETVRAMSAKHIMVVSDSCYSGTLTRGLTAEVKTGTERDVELRRLSGKRSRTALVSGGLEPVSDGGGDGHSVFTRAFLTALRESTEVLDGQQLFTAVRRSVVVKADQTPEYSDIRLAGHDGGDFLFVPVNLGATAALADAPAAQDSGGVSVDIQVWREIKDSTNAADFVTYIETFPSSPMVGFARNKLEQLETALVAPPEPETPAVAEEAVGVYPTTFKDCAECPEMVVIPPGEFVMGSPESEDGRERVEGPQHTVRIERPFALGKYEMTFAEWDACVADRGCNGYRPDDEGWGRDKRPAINVSWDDAKAYVGWLSRKSGNTYRFASESEWEYAARAGTTTARFWGEDADRGCGYANVYDRTGKRENKFGWTHHECDDGYAQTAPVGSFAANAFGVHDMLGNVWEWVGDCWNDSYEGAPTDGSTFRGTPSRPSDCSQHVLRGGSWYHNPRIVRAANRIRNEAADRYYIIGFRVTRTLDR
jgi:formylglycine-generating enzyme required for sulfatase activity/uncharacterized caspase-like protein